MSILTRSTTHYVVDEEGVSVDGGEVTSVGLFGLVSGIISFFGSGREFFGLGLSSSLLIRVVKTARFFGGFSSDKFSIGREIFGLTLGSSLIVGVSSGGFSIRTIFDGPNSTLVSPTFSPNGSWARSSLPSLSDSVSS